MSGLDEAVIKNVEACKQLSKITRTSLGPNGARSIVPRRSSPRSTLSRALSRTVDRTRTIGQNRQTLTSDPPAPTCEPNDVATKRTGMNKMVINHLDKLFVTSDAAVIVRELEVAHPVAKLLVMAAQAQ